jgi:hypothetical protein
MHEYHDDIIAGVYNHKPPTDCPCKWAQRCDDKHRSQVTAGKPSRLSYHHFAELRNLEQQ